MFKISLKGVSGVFKVCFKSVSRVLKAGFMGVSIVFAYGGLVYHTTVAKIYLFGKINYMILSNQTLYPNKSMK